MDDGWLKVKRICLGSATVELHDCGLTVTRFDDDSFVPAVAQNDDAYRQRAQELGYGSDTARMSRDHEIAHSLLAAVLGLPGSPTLRGVADGRHWPHWRLEEAACLALQAYAVATGVSLEAAAVRLAANDNAALPGFPYL